MAALMNEARIRQIVNDEINDRDFQLDESDVQMILSRVRSEIGSTLATPTTNGDDGREETFQDMDAWKEELVARLKTDLLPELKKLARPEPRKFYVCWPDETRTVVKGKAHDKFDHVLRLATIRLPILMVGPTGCGKTHLAEQVARAMNLPFSFNSCSAGMSEGQLMGRLLPIEANGRFAYVAAEFVNAYEIGGVHLLDEIDASDSNTLTCINAALANGKMALPNRPEKPYAVRHPDFVCMAAANTFGTGADRQYVGRNQLDEASIDRFRAGQVPLDYDAEVEAEICPDDGLRLRLQGYRQAIRDARLRRIVSSRFLRDAYVMKQAGFADQDIDNALFAGWSADEVSKVKGV